MSDDARLAKEITLGRALHAHRTAAAAAWKSFLSWQMCLNSRHSIPMHAVYTAGEAALGVKRVGAVGQNGLGQDGVGWDHLMSHAHNTLVIFPPCMQGSRTSSCKQLTQHDSSCLQYSQDVY